MDLDLEADAEVAAAVAITCRCGERTRKPRVEGGTDDGEELEVRKKTAVAARRGADDDNGCTKLPSRALTRLGKTT